MWSSVRTAGAVATVVMLVVPERAGAQRYEGSRESYRRAAAVLDAALAAHGGLARLQAVKTVSVRAEGDAIHRNQSPRVAPPYATTPTLSVVALDNERGRLMLETLVTYPGGSTNHNRTVVTGTEGWTASLPQRRWTTVPNPAIVNQRNALRRLPHVILLDAHARRAQLRYLGESSADGRRYDVVAHAGDDGQQLALYFDRGTRRLAKWEVAFQDVLTGDATAEFVFPDYRTVNGVAVPTGRVVRLAGEPVERVSYREVTVDQPLADSLFQRSPEWEDGNSAQPYPQTVETLAPGVHLVQGVGGANNTLVIELGDSLLAVEAYGSGGASEATLAKLREALPGKRLRWLVPTHHHDDHTGGLRTYVAEGATIVTTPGNRAYFERMARAPYTIQPDALARTPTSIRIETISGKKRVISDGTRTVEIHDIGPAPHADEMLVVYLPNERIIMQGDLLNRPPDGRVLPGSATTRYFADWLAKSGFAVDRIVGVHGPTSTPADLQRAVELMTR